jgi:hypothetical protein
MGANVWWAGTQDIDFTFYGNTVIDTSASRHRPSFVTSGPNLGGTIATDFVENTPAFAQSTFWMGVRYCNSFTTGNTTNAIPWAFLDVNRITRLRLRATSAGNPNNLVVEKVTAAGVATTLITITGLIWDSASVGNEATKMDVFVNYAVAGSISVYYKGVLLGTFTGDVTTDGITSLSYVRYGALSGGNSFFASECMVLDVDTRTCSLAAFLPVANGNTHTFDTGTPAAANVNETPLNDATLDGSTTANQIDQYTNAAVPTGTFSVLSFGVIARALKGTSGPTKMDLNVRTGGSDFFSADQVLSTFWQTYPNWWSQNPNTTADWTTAQIGSTAGFNIGVKSII